MRKYANVHKVLTLREWLFAKLETQSNACTCCAICCMVRKMLYNMFFYNMFPKLFTNYKIEFLCDMSYTNHFMNQFCLKRCLLQISFYGCVLTHKTEIPLFTGAALKATSTRHVFEHTQNSTSDCLQEAAGIKNMVSQRLSLF